MQLASTAGWSWLARGGHGQPAFRSDSASKGTPHGSGLSPRLVEGGTPPDGGRQVAAATDLENLHLPTSRIGQLLVAPTRRHANI
jgi:hypothetical protein